MHPRILTAPIFAEVPDPPITHRPLLLCIQSFQDIIETRSFHRFFQCFSPKSQCKMLQVSTARFMRLCSSPSVLAASLSACFKVRTCSCCSLFQLSRRVDVARWRSLANLPGGRGVSSTILCFSAEKQSLSDELCALLLFHSSFFSKISG